MKDYAPYLQNGLQKIIHDILVNVAKDGLTDDSYYMISFQTPKAKIPDFVRAKYPKEITIVLQNQFQDLKVNNKDFSVTLSFGGISSEVMVPFNTITNFVDPTQKFGLTLTPTTKEESTQTSDQKAEVIDLASHRKST